MKIAVIGAQYAPNRRRHGIENPTSGRFLVGEKSAAKGDAVMKRRSGHFGRMTILAGFAVRWGLSQLCAQPVVNSTKTLFTKVNFSKRPFWPIGTFGRPALLADFTLSEKKTNNE